MTSKGENRIKLAWGTRCHIPEDCNINIHTESSEFSLTSTKDTLITTK